MKKEILHNGKVQEDVIRDIDDMVKWFGVVIIKEDVCFARILIIVSRTAVFKKRESNVWLRERFLTSLNDEDYFRLMLLKECSQPVFQVSKNAT